MLWLLFGTLFLLSGVALRWHKRRKLTWVCVAIGSIGLMWGISFIWQQALDAPVLSQRGDQQRVTMDDPAVLSQFLEEMDSTRAARHEANAQNIPLGLELQQMAFDGPQTVTFSGIAWLKTDTNRSAQPNIYFPDQAPQHEIAELEPQYQRPFQGQRVQGYRFRIALQENLNYTAYPLDRHTLRVRFWAQSPVEPLRFVPDLSAYNRLNPTALPGLSDAVYLKGWSLIGAFYDYAESPRNSTYGVRDVFDNDTRFDLGYNVVIKRKFVGPFIQNLIPLLAIALLMFSLIVTATDDEHNLSRIGFSGVGVLELGAAFFFVMILAHLDLRRSLGVEEIIYMDYFYFVMYFQILLYSANSILFTHTDRFPVIEYKQNLLPKVLYFPVLLITLLAITVSVFY